MMSTLSNLKLISSQRKKAGTPTEARRKKLTSKLYEQIQLAKALRDGRQYAPLKMRTIRDKETGAKQRVEVAKIIKPWWWDENGKICVMIHYGAKVLELENGLNAVEVDDLSALVATLELIKSAADKGELDEQINSVSQMVRAGFKRDKTVPEKPDSDKSERKNGTLKLPAKSA
ncbi:MAG: hypothetical protein EBW14_09320 [Oxalobacteraceae bacterium]|nr:hypothetical protein [Oxalobacteraceae bacterium]